MKNAKLLIVDGILVLIGLSFQFVLIVGFLDAVLVAYLCKTLFVASVSYMTMMSMSVPVINTLILFYLILP